MDAEEIKRLRRRSGISVVEKPRVDTTGSRLFSERLVNILRAVLLITLFVVGGMGYSPIGCKTQYMFTDKYWYNKQIIIFLVLYLVINLRSSWQREEKEPFAVLRGTVVAFLIFNAVARMGDAWWADGKGWASGGPATWFGLALFPLVVLYVLDDTRRYYKAIEGKGQYARVIDTLYKAELVAVGVTALVLVVGFTKSYRGARRTRGGKLGFWRFLFGAPSATTGRSVRCQAHWPAYRSHLRKLSARQLDWKSAILPWTLLIGAVLIFQFILPTPNLDANQDGKVTAADIVPGLKDIWAATGGRIEAIPAEVAKKAFDEADKNKNGSLSLKEFTEWTGRTPAALHTPAVAVGAM